MGSSRSRTGTQNSTHLDGASPQAHSGPLGLAVSQPPAALTHCHPRQWTEEPPRQAAQRVDKSARPTSAKWTFDQCCLEDTRLSLNTPKSGSTWAVQSVKRLTLGFGSGHDLMGSWVRALHLALHRQGGACLGFSLSLSLCPSPACAVSVSLKINT